MKDSLESFGCTNVTITMSHAFGDGNNKYKVDYTQNGRPYHFEGYVHVRGKKGLQHHFLNVASASLQQTN